MPQTHPTGSRPERAPAALLLTPAHTYRPHDRTGRPLPDWYGLHPDHVARLIARYTRNGDTVLDLDGHPTVAAAARYLHRRPGVAFPHTDSGGNAPALLGEPDPAQLDPAQPGAGLLLATLPRWSVDSRDQHAMSQGLSSWEALLRTGGFLAILLAAGPGSGTLGHRSTVIAAARAAGLLYHQHIPALLAPLLEIETRTEARPAARPPLIAGRHVRAHRDLLVFATITPEDADV